MIKNFIFFILASVIFCDIAFAQIDWQKDVSLQDKIDSIGFNILNSNKIQKRIIFTYNEQSKKNLLVSNKELSKRQIIIYDGLFQYAQNDDEIAAMLANKIVYVLQYYKKFPAVFESKMNTKAFEIFADKIVVDYLVGGNYNPLALITYLTKSSPNMSFIYLRRHNSILNRQVAIYEYILNKYPKYLNDKTYSNNIYYQNFLLNSIEQRDEIKRNLQNEK